MMRGHDKAEHADNEGDHPGADELTAQPGISSIFEHDATPDTSAARRNTSVIYRFVRGAGGLRHNSVIGASAEESPSNGCCFSFAEMHKEAECQW